MCFASLRVVCCVCVRLFVHTFADVCVIVCGCELWLCVIGRIVIGFMWSVVVFVCVPFARVCFCVWSCLCVFVFVFAVACRVCELEFVFERVFVFVFAVVAVSVLCVVCASAFVFLC